MNNVIDNAIHGRQSLRLAFRRGVNYVVRVIVLLVSGLLSPLGANSQQQPAGRVYPWQSRPDVARLSDRFGIVVHGDENGPTSVTMTLKLPGRRYERLADHDVACLADWRSLKRVILGGGDLTAAALQYLRSCTELEDLDYWTLDSRGIDGRDIEPLEGLRKLGYLRLRCHRMSLDAMKHIGRLEGLELLGFASPSFSSTPVTDNGLAYLDGLKRLRDLDLSDTKVTAKGMKYLMPLKDLRHLGLLSTVVRQADVRELARSLPRLEISGDRWRVPRVGDENDRSLAGAYRTTPDLLRLSRHNVRVEANGTRSGATTVYTDDTDLNDRDLACLADWPLHSVTLAGKNLTAAVLQHLRSDKDLENLSLYRVNRGLDARDLEPLEGKEYLSYLCLEGNSITVGAMEQIGRMKHLAVLDLSGCPVTDDGLIHLADLECLWKLSLVDTKVTASGLRHLTLLKELRSLDLTQTAVKKGDVEELHRALPQLNIYGGTGRDTWEVEGARTGSTQ